MIINGNQMANKMGLVLFGLNKFFWLENS